MRALLMLLLLCAAPVSAETLVAARNLRAQTILTAADLTIIERSIPGMLQTAETAIGLETRVSLYAGRPIRPEDIGPPAIVDRNQIVTLVFKRGGLLIATEARALDRAGVGDILRVMNLSSRSTVTGIVKQDGSVHVGGPNYSNF